MVSATFAGVDRRTDVCYLPDAVEDDPFEYAVLYTATPEGRHRYPSKRDACELLAQLYSSARRAALHLCGAAARLELARGELSELVALVQRIQINGLVEYDELCSFTVFMPDHTIITQHIGPNQFLARSNISNHAVLVDGSGGRGRLPSKWTRPETAQAVGFAGGLSPETIRFQLPLIERVAVEPWWIDMEQGIRDADDWFDIQRVYDVAEYLVGDSPDIDSTEPIPVGE